MKVNKGENSRLFVFYAFPICKKLGNYINGHVIITSQYSVISEKIYIFSITSTEIWGFSM